MNSPVVSDDLALGDGSVLLEQWPNVVVGHQVSVGQVADEDLHHFFCILLLFALLKNRNIRT
jgi:hypothetical protein